MRPRDLPVAEDREHHRRIGRCDGCAEQAGGEPAEPERPVGEHRDQRRGRECAEDAERDDRDRRARKRRRPIDEPPSKRITINATVARRSTVSTGTRSAENASEATAAATRKNAAEGTEIRALSFAVSERERERAGHQQDVEPEMGDVVHQSSIRKSLPFAHSRHNSTGNTDPVSMRLPLILLSVLLVAPGGARCARSATGDGVLELKAVNASRGRHPGQRAERSGARSTRERCASPT